MAFRAPPGTPYGHDREIAPPSGRRVARLVVARVHRKVPTSNLLMMSPSSFLAILSLGFALGMRHATDSDHVVAVTTIVSRERSIRFAGVVGAVWGIGHTVTILLVGGAIILFHVTIPPRLGLSMEFAVALMLVVLGAANLAARGGAAHLHQDEPRPRRGGAPALLRSLFVGVVHGLGGSAAVALLVLTTIQEPRWAVLYLLLFGAGTIAGMMLLTSMIAVPFAVAADRFARVNRRMVQLTALASILLGLFIAYRIGFQDALFSTSPHWTPE